MPLGHFYRKKIIPGYLIPIFEQNHLNSPKTPNADSEDDIFLQRMGEMAYHFEELYKDK